MFLVAFSSINEPTHYNVLQYFVESVRVVLRVLKSCFVFCVCVDMIVFFTVSVTSNTQYDFQNFEVAFVYNFISLFPRILIVSELLSILDWICIFSIPERGGGGEKDQNDQLIFQPILNLHRQLFKQHLINTNTWEVFFFFYT